MACDEEAGVTSQGRTRTEAIENLDGAVALYNGEIGRPPTDEELREWGIDPEKNRTAGDLPSVLSGPIDGDGDTADNSSEGTQPEDERVVTRDFSGADVRKVLANAGNFRTDRQRGSHVVMKWEHPRGPAVEQPTVVVPLHDSLAIGTLRDIGEAAGMRDFDEFCR